MTAVFQKHPASRYILQDTFPRPAMTAAEPVDGIIPPSSSPPSHTNPSPADKKTLGQTGETFLYTSFYQHFIKRFFDILASGLGLLLLAPLFLYVARLIKNDSPGPVFYRAPRIGRNGKPFYMLKFRTMREEPLSYSGPRITANGDPRVTTLGKWLRDTKINELPQLINVFRGEMSLVGPRPEDPAILLHWPENDRKVILSVRPGVTSPASVSYRDEENRLDGSNLMGNYLEKIAPDKQRLDRLYVRHHSFMTDMDVLFWTMIVLVPRIARQPDTEGLLFGGPFSRFARPYLSWTSIDFSISMLVCITVGLMWRVSVPLNIGWEVSLLVAFVISLLFTVSNSLLGLKRVEWSRSTSEDLIGLIFSGLLVTAVSILADLKLPQITLPDGFLIINGIFSTVGFVIARYRLRLLTGLASRWVRARGYGTGERVLIVGAGAGGEIASWLLRRADFRHLFRIVGYVDDSPHFQGMRFDGIPVLGTTQDISSLVAREDIGLICYAIEKISQQDQEHILGICRKSTARLVILSDVMHSMEKHFFVEPQSR